MFDRHAKIITIFIILSILSISGFWGCNQSKEVPQKPKIVTKKIVMSTKPKTDTMLKKERTISGDPKARPTKKTKTKKTGSIPEQKKIIPKPKKKISISKNIPPTPTPLSTTKKEPLKKNIPSIPATKSSTENMAKIPIDENKPPKYNPEGKIDPFVALFKDSPTGSGTITKRSIKRRAYLTPIEKIDLTQLKLVGIIKTKKENKALVEEASGKGYIIKKGTYIGTHSGRVDQILKDKIVIDEPLLPVDEVAVNSMYDVDGKNFYVTKSNGETYIHVDGVRVLSKTRKIDGKSYYVDQKELKLQKQPGEN